MKYYVYLYKDPRSRQPIYIGKGSGGRAVSHWINGTQNNRLGKILKELQNINMKPIISVIFKESENEALRFEALLIYKFGNTDIGTGCLCNRTPNIDDGPYFGQVWRGIGLVLSKRE